MGGACAKDSTARDPRGTGLSGQQRKVFGVPLDDLLAKDYGARRTPYEVPRAVLQMVFQIRERGLEERDILLSSGEAMARKRLRQEMDAGRRVDLGKTSVHVCAGLLKSFLTLLPDPLTTLELEGDWIRIADNWDQAHSLEPQEAAVAAKKRAVEDAKGLMQRIPLPNRCLLWVLFRLADMIIDRKEVNGVGMEDACRCLQPCIFRKVTHEQEMMSIAQAPDLQDDTKSSQLIATMLLYQNHNDLFADIMDQVRDRMSEVENQEVKGVREEAPQVARGRPAQVIQQEGPSEVIHVSAPSRSATGNQPRRSSEELVQKQSLAQLMRRVEELEQQYRQGMQSMQARVDEAKQGSELATEKMEHMTKEVAKELNKLWGRLSNVETATAKVLEDHDTIKKQAKLMRKSTGIDFDSVLSMQSKISHLEDELDRHAIARDRLYVDMSRLQSHVANHFVLEGRGESSRRRITLPPMSDGGGETSGKLPKGPRARGAARQDHSAGLSWGVGDRKIGGAQEPLLGQEDHFAPRRRQIATSMSRPSAYLFGGSYTPSSGATGDTTTTSMGTGTGTGSSSGGPSSFGASTGTFGAASYFSQSTSGAAAGHGMVPDKSSRRDRDFVVHSGTTSTTANSSATQDGEGTYSFAELRAGDATTASSFGLHEGDVSGSSSGGGDGGGGGARYLRDNTLLGGAGGGTSAGSMPSLSLSDSTAGGPSSPYDD